jgi:flagellar motor switch protein FliN/FliY
VFSEGLVAVYRCTRGEDETEYTITHTMNGEMLPEEGEESSEEAKEAEEETVEASDVQAEAGEEAAVEEETAAETEEEAVPESAAEEAAPDTVEEEEGVSDDLAYEAEEDLMGTTDMAEFLGGGEGEESIVEVSRAEFEEFGEALPGDGKGRKIDLLLDVELDVSVELGRKVMVVEEILRLGKGSVVELNKLAGEPVDVLVNGKKLAEGEVVVVEDHFGVRLTHLLEPRERIKSLGK